MAFHAADPRRRRSPPTASATPVPRRGAARGGGGRPGDSVPAPPVVLAISPRMEPLPPRNSGGQKEPEKATDPGGPLPRRTTAPSGGVGGGRHTPPKSLRAVR